MCSDKKRLEYKVERLRMQNTEAIRGKFVVENKSHNLLYKVGALKKEDEGLNHQLGELKDVVAKSHMEA